MFRRSSRRSSHHRSFGFHSRSRSSVRRGRAHHFAHRLKKYGVSRGGIRL